MQRKRRGQSEKGSIVVEAAVALPVFMFAIVTMLSLVEICAAQTLITNTVNGIAKDISKFSYLYCKVGAYGAQAGVANKGAEATGVAVDALSVENINDLMGFVENSVGVIEESENFGQSICYMLLSTGIEAAIDGIGGEVIDDLAKKRIKTDSVSAEEKLNHYGVKDLKWHLRFDTATNQIYVLADYSIEVLKLLDVEYQFDFIKTTKTLVWNPETSYPGKDNSGD